MILKTCAYNIQLNPISVTWNMGVIVSPIGLSVYLLQFAEEDKIGEKLFNPPTSKHLVQENQPQKLC